jgi:hypothetical protein
MSARIFISYASRDRAWAHWIGVTLRDHGYQPLVHEWEIAAGENIARWMDEALATADHLLGVFTDEYARSLYASSDRFAAYWEGAPGTRKFLIPVEVEHVTEWPAPIRPLKRVSLVGLSEFEAEHALIAFLKPPNTQTSREATSRDEPGRIWGDDTIPVSRPAWPSSLRCHLSAPANIDAQVLRRVLNELGIRVDAADKLPPPGESLPVEIRRRLLDADFVCGIVTDEHTGVTNVMFELGIALGLGKPIFTVAHTIGLLPFGLRSFPHLVGNIQDGNALRFHLKGFLKNMEASTRAALDPAWPITRSRTPPSDTITALKRDANAEGFSEYGLVQVVARAFRALGAEISLEQSTHNGSRPDAIAWLPGAPTDLGTPFFVEVASVRNRRELTPKFGQIEAYMAAAGIRASLLVFLGAKESASQEIEVRNAGGGYLFILSLDILLNLIEHGRLLLELVEARNRFAHSGS